MTLSLDLSLLDSDKKFQQFCYRIARKEFPKANFVAIGSWDGGRDILLFKNEGGDVVWQCKFTRHSLSKLKNKIVKSLDTLDPSQVIGKWILCLSVDPTGVFLDWLRTTIAKYPFIKSWETWGQEALLERLEHYPDILETFFYPVWKSLNNRFRTEELELISYELDQDCGWKPAEAGILYFVQTQDLVSDLIFDIIVRNRGTIETLIMSAQLEVVDVQRYFRGLPGEGLLWS